MKRSSFIKSLAALPLLDVKTSKLRSQKVIPEWNFEPLTSQIEEKITIKDIKLVPFKSKLMLLVFSDQNLLGITQCNARMQHLESLLKGIVIPHFINQDARELPQLVDNAYRLNSKYKYAGMPLWNCIGTVEVAVWDLLGKYKRKPVFELLGKPIRTKYPVYVSDFNREGDVVKIVENIQKKLIATGAKGTKIKIGGRMKNTPENDAFMSKYIPHARKVLGDATTIYVDGNGSFSAKEGIEAGKLLEDYGIEIFEEPCNFENEDELRQVTKALKKLKLAGGEQDTSLYRFERLARTQVYDILQPDLYYYGGILRVLQVSQIAKMHGKLFAPHSPKTDPLIGPYWQVAALSDTLYGLQECVYNPEEKPAKHYSPNIKIDNGEVHISQLPGLGIAYDEKAILKNI